MSAPASLARADPPRRRTVELVLAHAHLRLGALALARVELETKAGLGLLDTPGHVDLAEVRWRTGDLLGAGEAATAALRDDEDLPVALVVAAEAAAALGRPTEARRLASRVIAGASASIDVIFAGMPRLGVWPDDAAEPPPTAPTLFDREPEHPGRAEGGEPSGPAPVAAERTGVPQAVPVALGFWDGEAGVEPASSALPDPAMELEAGRGALVAGALDEAALRFGLALRFAPALAPAVLEATDGARTASLTMVRGDAYRLAGHEVEARQAYAVAAQGGLPERRQRPRTSGHPEGTPDVEAAPVGEGTVSTGEHEPGADGMEATEIEAAVATHDDAPVAEPAAETEVAAETEHAGETETEIATNAHDATEADGATGPDDVTVPLAAAETVAVEHLDDQGQTEQAVAAETEVRAETEPAAETDDEPGS